MAETERTMSSQLGDGSACQVHKDGRVTGGMKYAEGKLVALNDLRRKLDAAGEITDDAALREILDAETARWRSGLENQRHRPKPAMPWLAYYQGGIDALEALRQTWFAAD
ncbi:MAG: hypothetical protein RMN52_12610 [Anaerolineae bacterium]|nr:hypothetical protein [Candidatus Roseilinea sp.]MDW8450832.1 hypothetical protein [Anaerolineae bacterium]